MWLVELHVLTVTSLRFLWEVVDNVSLLALKCVHVYIPENV